MNFNSLTHWGLLKHMLISILGQHWHKNSFSPVQRQTTIWANACFPLIEPLETNCIATSIKTKDIHFRNTNSKFRLQTGGYFSRLNAPANYWLMMASSDGNIFRVTDTLWGVSTGHKRIPHPKVQWHGALMFSLMCAGTNGYINSWVSGDLRRRVIHVMSL